MTAKAGLYSCTDQKHMLSSWMLGSLKEMCAIFETTSCRTHTTEMHRPQNIHATLTQHALSKRYSIETQQKKNTEATARLFMLTKASALSA